MILAGSYFPGGSSRAVPAVASLSANILTIADAQGVLLAEVPIKAVRVSARLGRLRRRIELPGSGYFETDDNDGVDAILQSAGRARRGHSIHRLESSLRWAALAVIVAGISIVLAFKYGFPATAAWLAWRTPRPIVVAISTQALDTMDRFYLAPSDLSAVDMRRARRLFARVASVGDQPRANYSLLFRAGGAIGPNAFSLPDGRIVMTDELYGLVKNDDELEGVFGHEIAHADRRHVLVMLYEGSMIPAAIALITGDVSQIGQIAAVLPTILMQSAYSRNLEQQADDDAARAMRKIGANPAALGAFLERLDSHLCGKQGCSMGWLGTHPDTATRAARLREGKSAGN